jgi:hypothetical protein
MRLLIVAGMLVLAVSASLTPANAGRGYYLFLPMARNEAECETVAHGLRVTGYQCHCSFECYRQYSYSARLPCSPGAPGWHEGLCEQRVVPVEAGHACMARCVAARVLKSLPVSDPRWQQWEERYRHAGR